MLGSRRNGERPRDRGQRGNTWRLAALPSNRLEHCEAAAPVRAAFASTCSGASDSVGPTTGRAMWRSWAITLGERDMNAKTNRPRDDPWPRCNASDLEVLASLYEATGGTEWTNSDGWLGDGAVGDWHGVASDSLGHVTTLGLWIDLDHNLEPRRIGAGRAVQPRDSGPRSLETMTLHVRARTGGLPLRVGGVPRRLPDSHERPGRQTA